MTGGEALGFVMLVSMVGIIFIGFPISFTLLFLALIVGGFGLGWEQTFNLAYIQIWGTMKDEIFPAVPLFIFMGFMTEQAGLMERLFGALRSLLAPVRGALYLAVLLTATIFAMATGIVGAAVTVLGIMAAPMMLKSRYDARLSAGAIAAGGTLGILLPPSIMLVVMGPVMGVPVNLLYSAAFGPGFLLAGCYIIYTLVRSFINPTLGPAMTMDERKAAYDAMTTERVRAPVVGLGLVSMMVTVYFLADAAFGRLGVPPLAVGLGPLAVSGVALVPAMATAYPYVRNPYFRAIVLGIAPLAALIGFTLGTIVGGLATPTEAASCGAFGAALLALVYGRLDFKAATNAAMGTMVTVAMVRVPGHGVQRIRRRLHQARLGERAHAVASRAPHGRLLEARPHHGDLLHPGMAVRMARDHPGLPADRSAGDREAPVRPEQAGPADLGRRPDRRQHADGLLEPPVAMSAYYLRNVVPEWSLSIIFKGMADYMVIQVIVLALLLLFPQIALWLPHAVR